MIKKIFFCPSIAIALMIGAASGATIYVPE